MKGVICCAALSVFSLLGNPAQAGEAKSEAYRDGISSFEKGNYKGAIAAFTEATRVAPTDAKVYFARKGLRRDRQGCRGEQGSAQRARRL